MGILAAAILASVNTTLRGTGRINSQTSATGYVIKCLEWFLGQRSLNGFGNITCNSTNVPVFCNVPGNYTITTNVACTSYGNDTNNYKTITAVVNGTLGSDGSENISLIIANY
jgi:hypothetical protein